MKVGNGYSFSPNFSNVQRQISYYHRLISSTAKTAIFEKLENFPNKTLHLRAKNLAKFYDEKRAETVESRKVFGKNLIHYGINLEKASTFQKEAPPKLLQKLSSKAKKAAYEAKWSSHPHATEKKSEGICLAASMDCIQRYLQLKKKGVSDQRAFSKVTAAYKHGMSEELAILQHLEGKSGKGLDKEADPQYYTKKHSQGSRLFSELFHIKQGNHHFSEKAKYSDFLNKAPKGTYLVSLMNNGLDKGHAMVIVKNKDQSLFIYDPNFGAAVIPKDEAKATLKRLFNHSYYQDLNTLVYTRSHLKL